MFDECEHCGEEGGIPKGSKDRTRAAGVVIDRKAEQGCTLALTLRNKAKASVEQKRKLDGIISTEQPMFKKARQVAMDPDALEAARESLFNGFFAASTVAAYSAEIHHYEQIMANCGVAPWPLTVKAIENFGAVLKSCNYRSSRMYFSAIVTMNSQMGFSLAAHEQAILQKVKTSCSRDNPDDAFKEPVTLEMLTKMNDLKDASPFRILVARLAVIALFFLLRSESVLTLRGICGCSGKCKCNTDIKLNGRDMTIYIRGEKTDQTGTATERSVSCACGGTSHLQVPTCPVCALRAIKRDSTRGSNPATWWLSQGNKQHKLGYDGFLRELNVILSEIGEQTKHPDGSLRFGTQSLRRGGAQELAFRGVPVHQIKRFGRWKSWIVERYVREAPLHNFNAARIIFNGTADGERIEPTEVRVNDKVLVPHVGEDLWLQGVVTAKVGSTLTVKVKAAVGAEAPDVDVKVQSDKVVRR